jgi:hypothetical protein
LKFCECTKQNILNYSCVCSPSLAQIIASLLYGLLHTNLWWCSYGFTSEVCCIIKICTSKVEWWLQKYRTTKTAYKFLNKGNNNWSMLHHYDILQKQSDGFKSTELEKLHISIIIIVTITAFILIQYSVGMRETARRLSRW